MPPPVCQMTAVTRKADRPWHRCEKRSKRCMRVLERDFNHFPSHLSDNRRDVVETLKGGGLGMSLYFINKLSIMNLHKSMLPR